MDHIITVNNLTKRYKDFLAVDHVSFEVQRGEIFGILGPNGAGKTTTLEMIEGLKKITSGDATLNGISVKHAPQQVKHLIGVQLQSSSFFDLMNLKELLELFGNLYGRTIDAMTLLDKVSLSDKWKNRARELSGGQRQRLSIAIALVNDPLVIFLDEPTTGLDPQARHHLWALIRDIQAAGKTVVLTTHYMEEAETLCERIAIMDNSHIIALDTPVKLMQSINQQAKISFLLKENSLFDFNTLPGVTTMKRLKDTVSLSTTNPQMTLTKLVQAEPTIHFTDLQVRETNLEDVFLTLTGKSLRE